MLDGELRECLTFDDVMLTPAYSEVWPAQVDLKTRVTRGIEVNIPLVSAAMDSVTEARAAVTIAREGGIGIIHKNLPPRDQAAEVDRAAAAPRAASLPIPSRWGPSSRCAKRSRSCTTTMSLAFPWSRATRPSAS